MFGKKPATRRIFSRHRRQARIPWAWIIVGVLALLLWLVPANSQPVISLDQITPFIAN